jgi:hypothetical protein
LGLTNSNANRGKEPSSSKRSYPATIFASAFLLFPALLLGCGGSSSPQGLGAAAPPFNTALGEGNLVSNTTVQVYPTSNPNGTALDTFFYQLACPSGGDQSICTTNQASLNSQQFGNFDLSADPIGKNSLGIQKVDAVKIDYTAINVDGSADTVSGGIAIPEVAASSIKGIILYFHGTTVDWTNVPSNFESLSNSSYTDGSLMAAVWASQGYVVVMPDYIGLGDDTSHPHPYVVYPQQNAQSGLAMLKASNSLLGKNYGLTANLPLFVTGYSEGGAYSLEAGHLMQDNAGYATALNVTLKKVVPLSGYFDLSNTGLSYLFANIQSEGVAPYFVYDTELMQLSKPFLMAYLVSSYAHYASVTPTTMLAAKFDPPCSPNCDTLYQLYFTSNPNDTIVATEANVYATSAGYLNQQSDSVTPLLTTAYATALMNHDATNPLYQQVAAADTYTFTPQFPVTLLSLEQDSVVTRANSDVAYQHFTAKGPAAQFQEILIPNTSFETAGELYGYYNIDHTTEVPFLSVLMLNQFNQAPAAQERPR